MLPTLTPVQIPTGCARKGRTSNRATSRQRGLSPRLRWTIGSISGVARQHNAHSQTRPLATGRISPGTRLLWTLPTLRQAKWASADWSDLERRLVARALGHLSGARTGGVVPPTPVRQRTSSRPGVAPGRLGLPTRTGRAAARGGTRHGHLSRHTSMSEDSLDHRHLVEERDETQPAPAPGARQEIEAKRALHQRRRARPACPARRLIPRVHVTVSRRGDRAWRSNSGCSCRESNTPAASTSLSGCARPVSVAKRRGGCLAMLCLRSLPDHALPSSAREPNRPSSK